jgi:hypothetical protein
MPTNELVGLAKDTSVSDGAPDISFVIIPHPVAGISDQELRAKADRLFPELLTAATSWKPVRTAVPQQKSPYPAEVFKFTGTVSDINNLFLSKKWALGLPIVPPTPERVAAMLKGTTRKPNEVLGQILPRMGTVTVEIVAVHAVMAGGKPEYMPALIATVEAMLTAEANWGAINTTTGTVGWLIVFNGPVVKDIGIAWDSGASGKMHHANASIGYAVNLISAAVGGSVPPQGDKSSFGGPADYVAWILGENESKLPKGWEPLHVSRGFNKGDSVVTVFGAYPPVDLTDHWSKTVSDSFDALRSLATPRIDAGGTCRPDKATNDYFLILGPEHAALAQQANMNKEQYRKAFWEAARQPISWYPKACTDMAGIEKYYGIKPTPETLLPITDKPERINIMVGGGFGRHSLFFTPFWGTNAASKKIGN